MNYKYFSLNGTWRMDYCEEKYLGIENPFTMEGSIVKNAVPGYWEDMIDKFACTKIYRKLRMNPRYGIQRYPMTEFPPTMALPNVIGNFFYQRTFNCKNLIDKKCAIHFGGVQNAVSVWLNDTYLGRHEGYSTPFDFDIPDGLLHDGENNIVLSISNQLLEGFDGQPVSGLTSTSASEGTGGVTGDIEIRVYSCPLRDVNVIISEDCTRADVTVKSVEPCETRWYVYDGKKLLKSGNATEKFSFDTSNLELWSPASPNLYTLVVECNGGSIERRFGVRRLLTEGFYLRFNGEPYYLRGICEHCYFPMTVHPNHDIDFYRNNIRKIKSLGFNFIRCHTFVPAEEYLRAADEEGILFEVESPNNTTIEEWKHIVDYASKHPCVVMYSCGNEVYMSYKRIEEMRQIAEDINKRTDSLFSPMSALRGLYYGFRDEDLPDLLDSPLQHNPRKFAVTKEFCDVYNAGTNGQHSYISLSCDSKLVDSWATVYEKPRVSHEICINGTFADLSLKDRYKETRIGNTELFTSVEKHLDDVGVLDQTPLYFKNSSEWQRRVRKYGFEAVRISDTVAGYDFLGPIDTHWHTFGYDVGMMNEFYELKPGETVRNVLMYNSPTVILTDLGLNVNFECGSRVDLAVSVSHFEDKDLEDAVLSLKLIENGKVIERKKIIVENITCGIVQKVADCYFDLPVSDKPHAYKIYATLDGGATFTENEWEIYSFPKTDLTDVDENVIIATGDESIDDIKKHLKDGRNVVFFGKTPFVTNPTDFQISIAGRTAGDLATVVNDHPVIRDLPHEGFCSWQFRQLMTEGSSVCFADNKMPFEPIIQIVSTHKCFTKKSAMFEFKALGGKLFVCSFAFHESDPAAAWLKNQILNYVNSTEFDPTVEYTEAQLDILAFGDIMHVAENPNIELNPNDIAAFDIPKK